MRQATEVGSITIGESETENKEQTSGNTPMCIGPLLTGTSFHKGR